MDELLGSERDPSALSRVSTHLVLDAGPGYTR